VSTPGDEGTVITPRRLTDVEAALIAGATPANLDAAVAPLLSEPVTGLVAVVSTRSSTPRSRHLCAALVLSHDPDEDVTRAFRACGGDRMARGVNSLLPRSHWLPLRAHMWRLNWEGVHLQAAWSRLLTEPEQLPHALRRTLSWGSRLLRSVFWHSAAELLGFFRWRAPREFVAWTWEPLVGFLADLLVADTPRDLLPEVGEASVSAVDFDEAQSVAARILERLHRDSACPSALSGVRAAVEDALPYRSANTRREIGAWIDTSWMEGVRLAATRPGDGTPSTPFWDLLARTRSRQPETATQAASKLLSLGDEGRRALLGALLEVPPPEAIEELVGAYAAHPAADLEPLWNRLLDPEADILARFLVGIALVAGGRREALPHVLALVSAQAEEAWLGPREWTRLQRAAGAHPDVLMTAARLPNPHLASRAAELLARGSSPLPQEHRAALLGFLENGLGNPAARRLVADRLANEREEGVFPLLLTMWLEKSDGPLPLSPMPADLGLLAVRSVLIAGLESQEVRLRKELGREPRSTQEACVLALFRESSRTETLQALGPLLPRTSTRDRSAARLASLFAWGTRRGLELTGRRLRVEPTSGGSLGHTDLTDDRIFVNPSPVLAGQRDGEAITRGLIVHEIGHHAYDGGPESREVARIALVEGLAPLLNLLEDERLERRLRAHSEKAGRDLKTLAAWAFRHREQDLDVPEVLAMLGRHAFPVLVSTPFRPAHAEHKIRLCRGSLLAELESRGESLARFARALRMGLGNRHCDLQVAEGLRLCRNLRTATPRQLLDLARQLAHLFGHQPSLLEQLCLHAASVDEALDDLRAAEGTDWDAVRRAAESLLRRPESEADDAGECLRPAEKAPGGVDFDSDPETDFAPMALVEPVPFDAGRHALAALRVARWSRRLRESLSRLGIVMQPEPRHVTGHRVDRGRLLPLILRRDPRLLVARRPRVHADLFLAVLVDCSGSMVGDEIERARALATMVAEAVRGVPGIDSRFLGFTDDRVYDAGPADRCSASSLEAGGGNNDAGALDYAARLARRSRRSARLLVMISDGLPTECSTSALRALVDRLTRHERIACAQLAVRPLEEVCFPHYLEVADEDLEATAPRFGALVQKLVQRTLAGGA
jgi:hypothetical protein